MKQFVIVNDRDNSEFWSPKQYRFGMNRSRAALLQHLNLLRDPGPQARIVKHEGDSESEGYNVFVGDRWLSAHLTLGWAEQAVHRYNVNAKLKGALE